MNRRRFLSQQTAACLAGMSVPFAGLHLAGGEYPAQQCNTAVGLQEQIDQMPNFCSHEHWGSIQAIGTAPEQNGYRADVIAGAGAQRPVSVWDLVLDPYAASWMRSADRDMQPLLKEKGYTDMLSYWKAAKGPALRDFEKMVRPLVLTGVFQCTRRGIEKLHGADLVTFSAEEWAKADQSIARQYDNLFEGYTDAMKRLQFSGLIRPVHPEFYIKEISAAARKEEAAFTHTVMRIDPFLDLWDEKSQRLQVLADMVNEMPGDAAGFRRFLRKWFDRAAAADAVGIKQLQAYRRAFNFEVHSDVSVKFRGKLDEKEIVVFQDWMMHECCKLANERGWVHQVHVGTHNLGESSPLPLEELSKRYGKMKIVMIHCWPFLEEAGWLAKMRPNIYIDSCWLPVLNPAYLDRALQGWLGYVPAHKLMLGHDCTHIEMAGGSSLYTREILAARLAGMKQQSHLPEKFLLQEAAAMLHNNAVDLYKIGNRYDID